MAKFCGNCGKELKETTKYCSYCGEASGNKLPETKHKKRRKSMGVFVTVIIVLLVGVIAGYLLLNNPHSRTLRAIEKGNYALAADIIVQNKRILESAELTMFLEEKIEILKTAYEQETMTYEDVEDELYAIEGLAVPGVAESLENAKQTLLELYRSRTYQTMHLLQSEVFYSSGLDERTVFTYTYDEKGVLTGWQQTSEEYNGYGTYDQLYVVTVNFTRDETGNVQKVIVDEDGELFEMDVEYSDGQLVRYSYEYDDGDQCAVEFEYDADNRLTLAQWVDIYDGEEDVYQQVKMKYHSDGWIEERSWMNVFGSDLELVEKYNADGELCERLEYHNDTFAIGYIYHYNENGQLVNRDTKDKDGIYTKIAYSYDDNGYLTRIVGNSDLTENEYGWLFAGNSKILETKGWIGDNRSIGYSYSYDDNGNILKKTRIDQGENEDEVLQQIECTYIDVDLPMNYDCTDVQDPRYLLFISDYQYCRLVTEYYSFYF